MIKRFGKFNLFLYLLLYIYFSVGVVIGRCVENGVFGAKRITRNLKDLRLSMRSAGGYTAVKIRNVLQ